MNLGRLGIWSAGLRATGDPQVADAAAELEELGYSTLWIPAGRAMRGFEVAQTLLGATRGITVATGITSIWETTTQQSDAGVAELDRLAPGRFLLGLGVSHAPLVDKSEPHRYQRPLAAMQEYLAGLRAVPPARRIIAALGPKMLQLAVAESLGTHPYLITPSMTAALREQAPHAVIAPEHAVVLESDPDRARSIARDYLRMYLALPNYVNNWLRAGYESADVESGASDRLVDDLVAWGSLGAVAARIGEHYAAGADHVCLQVLGTGDRLPLAQWRELAAALVDSRLP
jgi:probable F420-dependent oxidoreductase